MRGLLLLVALTLPCACAGSPTPAPAGPAVGDEGGLVASGMEFAETFEIRFGDQLAGYLVVMSPVPDGLRDAREWPEGTALIQDKTFALLGFISPRGTTYRFDQEGEARAVAFGSRARGIAAFFRKPADPRLVSIHLGTTSGG